MPLACSALQGAVRGKAAHPTHRALLAIVASTAPSIHPSIHLPPISAVVTGQDIFHRQKTPDETGRIRLLLKVITEIFFSLFLTRWWCEREGRTDKGKPSC